MSAETDNASLIRMSPTYNGAGARTAQGLTESLNVVQ
jgi:hypothetical protein